jgi:hypothetical protein
MTDDLVKRLRRDLASGLSASIGDTEKAADRIEELEAALRKIETLELDPRNSGQMWVEALRQIARKALGEKTDD